MEHGTTLLAVLHIFVALLLVTIVLLQDSKGGGVGGAFGGGGSQTLFGATGAANFLVKITRVLAIIFMCTCIGLTLILTRRSSRSVVDLPAAGYPSNSNAMSTGPKSSVPAGTTTANQQAAPNAAAPVSQPSPVAPVTK